MQKQFSYTMFDALRPQLEVMGVKSEGDWQTTREKIARGAKAQLKRRNLRSATVVKWHQLGVFAGVK